MNQENRTNDASPSSKKGRFGRILAATLLIAAAGACLLWIITAPPSAANSGDNSYLPVVFNLDPDDGGGGSNSTPTPTVPMPTATNTPVPTPTSTPNVLPTHTPTPTPEPEGCLMSVTLTGAHEGEYEATVNAAATWRVTPKFSVSGGNSAFQVTVVVDQSSVPTSVVTPEVLTIFIVGVGQTAIPADMPMGELLVTSQDGKYITGTFSADSVPWSDAVNPVSGETVSVEGMFRAVEANSLPCD